jgi:hypothetical protein
MPSQVTDGLSSALELLRAVCGSPLRLWMSRRMAAKVAKDRDAPIGSELWLHWHACKITLVSLAVLLLW